MTSDLANIPVQPKRLASLDAYRGWVMFLVMAEVLSFCAVSAAVPGARVWHWLCYQQSHAQWVGCHLHDLIQPSFMFLVGVSLAFSTAKRVAAGQGFGCLLGHAVRRSIALILLGMVIVCVHTRAIKVQFIETLTQIGMAYFGTFLLTFRPVREWGVAFCILLAVHWLAFALYPVPAPGFDYDRVGVSAEWLQSQGLQGFAAHWQKNSNLGWAFDVWLLNRLPQDGVFVGTPDGVITLNFVPTIATMILGLFAGRALLQVTTLRRRLLWLLSASTMSFCAGLILHASGICPIIKLVWTPAWVLFSGGWCFLLLAGFHLLVDYYEVKKPFFPFIVVGMNSIAAYCLAHFYSALAFGTFRILLGREIFNVFGEQYEPLVYGALVLCAYWVCLFTLYRLKIFLKL